MENRRGEATFVACVLCLDAKGNNSGTSCNEEKWETFCQGD